MIIDTVTHLIMGVGLYGLSHLNPDVSSNDSVAQAVMFATIIGSQIPDIDIIHRASSSASYIRNHRGWTHSLPMLFLWPILLTLSLYYIYSPDVPIGPLFVWSSLAVLIHIFTDLFNPYGTQVLLPFSQRWIAFNVINLVDVFVLGSHVLGFILWRFTDLDPGYIFLVIYILIALYFGLRTIMQHDKMKLLKKEIVQSDNQPFTRYTVMPTMRWSLWNTVVEQGGQAWMGTIRGNKLSGNKPFYTSDRLSDHAAIEASRHTDAVSALRYFSSYVYPKVYQTDYGYEVHWTDIRYLYLQKNELTAVAMLDDKLRYIESFVGVYNKRQIKSKVCSILQKA